jgi:hypothetical protein
MWLSTNSASLLNFFSYSCTWRRNCTYLGKQTRTCQNHHSELPSRRTKATDSIFNRISFLSVGHPTMRPHKNNLSRVGKWMFMAIDIFSFHKPLIRTSNTLDLKHSRTSTTSQRPWLPLLLSSFKVLVHTVSNI